MKIFRIAMAFVGVVIGAGFATGQEIIQYFTSFGVYGIFGAIISLILFAFVGMVLLELGSYYTATSHDEVLTKISNKTISKIIDVILLITMFGIGVVMIAGAGSNLSQQFDVPTWFGSILLVSMVIAFGMLDTDKVVSAISSVTPFIIIFILIISIGTLFFTEYSFQELNPVAQTLESTLPHWIVSGANYASFNLTLATSMSLVIGGSEKQGTARKAGLFGGITVGVLILLINFTLFAEIDVVGQYSLPTVELAANIHPIVGFLMSISVFTLIWNTAMSIFYSVSSRFSTSGTKQFRVILIGTVLIAFGLSFFGFTNLVSYFYPFAGYLGFLLIAVLTYGWYKMKLTQRQEGQQESQHIS